MSSHNGTSPTATRTAPAPAQDPRNPKTPPPRERKGHGWVWFSLFLLVLAVIVAVVTTRKWHASEQLKDTTQQMATPAVLVTKPVIGDAEIHITLPGTVNALMESSVYAQVSGYIKRWLVDIGAKVKEGELLAEIDTPVTDQQLLQAAESVKQAQANLDLARATAKRYNDLFSSHAVSQQDIDNQNAGVKVQEANLDAAKAFEGGIQKTEAFKQVRAPFDGVVTARRVDVGDYVSATGQTASTGSAPSQSGTPNQELFRVAQTKILRIYVNVPEHFADEIKPGIQATIDLASAPGRHVTGKLARTSDSIDPTSLTLLSEVDVDNADGQLLPGGYAQVHFDIAAKRPPLVIPGNSLIFREQGPQVGVVDESGTVHLKSIKIGRDLGNKIEILEGIEPNDSVIVNPSDSLTDGQKVRVDDKDEQKKP